MTNPKSTNQPGRPATGKANQSADNDADLGDAIQQLESLLDAQTRDADSDAEALPVLDDVVEDEPEDDVTDANSAALNSAAANELVATLTDNAADRPDPQQIRRLLDQLAEQMEIELETVVGMLKHSVLQDFRSELAAALKLDPQQLDSQDDDNHGSAYR